MYRVKKVDCFQVRGTPPRRAEEGEAYRQVVRQRGAPLSVTQFCLCRVELLRVVIVAQ